MNRIRIGRVVPVTIAVVLLVIASSVVALSAKSANPFDQILAKLDEIIAALTPPAPADSVTLATPALLVGSNHSGHCTLTNLGTENLEVFVRVLDESGDVTIQDTPLVEAGSTFGFGTGLGSKRCEFTFEATATLVRAHLQVVDLSSTTAVTSVDAR
jgi:hypothetical protein